MKNNQVSLICSNCTGGVLYHWLGLEFKSPFINLFMDNKEFLTVLENFDEFIDNEIIEDTNTELSYPVGIGCHGERIHFMHYKSFSDAISKWDERKKRIDRNNMAVMLTNFGSGLSRIEIDSCLNNTPIMGGPDTISLEQKTYSGKDISTNLTMSHSLMNATNTVIVNY